MSVLSLKDLEGEKILKVLGCPESYESLVDIHVLTTTGLLFTEAGVSSESYENSEAFLEEHFPDCTPFKIYGTGRYQTHNDLVVNILSVGRDYCKGTVQGFGNAVWYSKSGKYLETLDGSMNDQKAMFKWSIFERFLKPTLNLKGMFRD